jgi:hypothetical protein
VLPTRRGFSDAPEPPFCTHQPAKQRPTQSAQNCVF